MNIGIVKSKTTIASAALLVLSLVRLWAGDATALQGVQEAIMSIVPMLLRSAVWSDAGRIVDQVKDAQAPADAGQVQAEPAAGGGA